MRAKALRCAAILLVVAGGMTAGGVAQAETVDGVTVPNAVLTAGTGNQVVDITISAGSPVVGSSFQLTPDTEDGYAVGISAAGVGGSCTEFSSASWSCEPTGSGWHAGSIRLTISTAEATPCCGTLPLSLQIVGDGTPIDVYGSIAIDAAPQTSAPTTKAPTKAPTTVATKTERSEPTSAPATTKSADQAAQQASSAATTSSPAASPSKSAAVAAGASVAPSTSASATAAGTVSSAANLPATVDAADAKSSSSSPWILGGVAVVVVLLAAGAFAGRRVRASRRRD
jgi:hypothetical protein